MQVVNLMNTALAKLAACRQAGFPELLFVEGMSAIVTAFQQYPQAWQDVEECWGVFGIDQVAISGFVRGIAIPGVDARGRVATTLEDYLKTLIERLAEPIVPASAAHWGEGSQKISMFDAMQQTLVGPRLTPEARAYALQASRTTTESKLVAISAPTFATEAVKEKLSGTRIFATDDYVPETSGAFARIEERPPQPSAAAEPAIVTVKVMLDALWAFDGDQDGWLIVVKLFLERFSEDIVKKLLRDAPISLVQFREIVARGTEDSEAYLKFRNVFIERLRAFLTLRLLELSKEEMSRWPEIMRLAHECISEKEWPNVFGSTRQATPARGAIVTGPQAQEVSRAYRYLSAALQQKIALPW